MRKVVGISLGVMIAMLMMLVGCVFVPVEYEETQTTIGPGEALQIEIDVNSHQTLVGDWTAEGEVAGSYNGPNDDNRAWQTSTAKNRFTIEGQMNPGLYTFKFRNDGDADTTVYFRYRFQ